MLCVNEPSVNVVLLNGFGESQLVISTLVIVPPVYGIFNWTNLVVSFGPMVIFFVVNRTVLPV